MVQETETAPAVETSPSPAAPPEAAPSGTVEIEAAPAPAEEGGEQPPAAQETPPQDFETIIASFIDETSPHAERWREYREQIEAEGFARATNMLAPQLQESQQRAQEAARLFEAAKSNYSTLAGRIQKLIDTGVATEEELTNALQSVPQAWAATQAIGEQAQAQAFESGKYTGAAETSISVTELFVKEAARLTGKTTLESRYLPRLEAARRGVPLDGHALLQEIINDIRKAGYEPGLKDGAAGAVEAVKVKARKGDAPAQSVGAHMASGRPTIAEYVSATMEQRREWAEKGIEPIIE